jgi:tellurite resistance protein TerC
MGDLTFWIVFHLLVIVLILLDLVVLNRDPKHATVKLASLTAGIWAVIGLAFGAIIWWYRGSESAVQYWTGYLLEQSLSVDNLFVFLMIFQYFAVPLEYRRRALLWGIVAAIFLRGLFIFAGVALVAQFHWTLYVLGALLVYTGFKMLRGGEDEIAPDRNPALLLCRRFLRLTPDYVGDRFSVRQNGFVLFTPLLVVLMVINTTDVMFATDSIPAILGITQDSLVVYTSNIMAVCGLRALYFALQGLFDVFHLLKYGLAVILSFIGVKMLVEAPLEHHLHLTQLQLTLGSLGVVVLVLAASVILSLLYPKQEEVAA